MPTQLPKESTDFFGELVLPYVSDIITSDATKPLEEHNFQTPVYNVRVNILFYSLTIYDSLYMNIYMV